MRRRRGNHSAFLDRRPPPPSFGRRRVTIVIFAIITGAMLGTILTLAWGVNFRTRVVRVEHIGIFYRLALPDDIADLNDVRLAQIAVPGADAFGRMSINNYWLSSTESPQKLIDLSALTENQAKEAKEIMAAFGTDRHHDNVLTGAMLQLRKGRNFFVFEMENRFAGYCAGGFRLLFNGQDLRGVPFDAPSGDEEVRSLAGNPIQTSGSNLTFGTHV